jgi:hypothetical protein
MRKLIHFLFFLPALTAGIWNTDFAQMSIQTAAADSSASAAAADRESIKWYTMIANIPRDWERWYNISFRKDRADEWLAVGGLTLAAILTDDITYSPADRFYHSSSDAKRWSDIGAEIGDGRTQFALAGAFGAYGLVFKDQRALRTGSQIVQAVLASGAVVQLLKHLTGRESPLVRTTPTGVWKILPNQVDYHRYVPHFDAFPSGHICTSITTVIVIAENYPDSKWIRPVGYGFTTIVGLGMLSNGIHWLSDYPLGLFIGYYFGLLAAHPEGVRVSGDGLKVDLLPSITPAGTGVSLAVGF